MAATQTLLENGRRSNRRALFTKNSSVADSCAKINVSGESHLMRRPKRCRASVGGATPARGSQSRLALFGVIWLLLVAAPVLAQTRPSDLQIASLFPASGSSSICPDSPLRITFASPPALGAAGKIQIFDAVTNSAVETIDVSSKTSIQTIGGIEDFTYYPVIISGMMRRSIRATTP